MTTTISEGHMDTQDYVRDVAETLQQNIFEK